MGTHLGWGKLGFGSWAHAIKRLTRGRGTQKKQVEIELARLNFMCMVAHGPDDNTGGWWGAVGDGSGGGCACSDAGGGLVLVLTWYLVFP